MSQCGGRPDRPALPPSSSGTLHHPSVLPPASSRTLHHPSSMRPASSRTLHHPSILPPASSRTLHHPSILPPAPSRTLHHPSILPPASSRTLHHPSFLPLYMAAGFGRHDRNCTGQTVHPINPAEFFYTDPTLVSGRRIPNTVTDLRVWDCFQLNTPAPAMTVCPAPPHRPDPFRSGPHPTRDLGSPVWRTPTNYHLTQPSQFVVQLTQEEDQAITNLLKLHHQSPLGSSQTFSAAQVDFSRVSEPKQDLNPSLFHQRPANSSSVEEIHQPLCCDVQQGLGWSDAELEAANTLLNGFIPSEEDRIWGQTHLKSAEMHFEPLPRQHPGDSSVSTETQHGSEALPALATTHSAQDDINNNSSSRVRENEEHSCGGVWSSEDGVSGRLSALRGPKLTDSEGDAVCGLLILGGMGSVDTVQNML